MKTKLLTLVCLVSAMHCSYAQLDSSSVSRQASFQSSLNTDLDNPRINSFLAYEQAHMLNQHWMIGGKILGGQQGSAAFLGFNPYARYYFGNRTNQRTHFFAGVQFQSSLLFTDEVHHNFTYGPQLGLNHFLNDNVALELTNNLLFGKQSAFDGQAHWQTRLQLRSFSSTDDTKQGSRFLGKGSLLLGQNWLRYERIARQANASFNQIEFTPNIQYFLTDRISIGTDSRLLHNFISEIGNTTRYDLSLSGRYYFSKEAWPIFVASNISYHNARTRTDSFSRSYDEWKVGAALGLTKNIGKGMALDLKLGIDRHLNSTSNQDWLINAKLGLKFNIGN